MASTRQLEERLLTDERSEGEGGFAESVDALYKRLLASTCYRTLDLYVDLLDRPAERAGSRRNDLEMRRLSEEDVSAYLADSWCKNRSRIVWKLRSGDECFGAFSGSRLIGHVWTTDKRTRVAHVDLPVYLERDTLYSHDLFVAPEFRNDGVATALLRHRRERLQEKGFGRVVTAIPNDNAPAVRVHQAAGAEFLGVIDVRFVGPWRKGRLRFARGWSVKAPLRLLEY